MVPIEQVFPGVARDGAIHRALLSAQLLADPARLAQLEAIVHPLVRDRLGQFWRAANRSGASLAVADIPLLFETGFDYGIDKVAVTLCDPALQQARALARPGMSAPKLEAILARQMPQSEKRARADYRLDTSGPLEKTRHMVADLVRQLRQADKGR